MNNFMFYSKNKFIGVFMANKVVICGIDTSTLPKCNNETMIELMNKIKSGDDLSFQQGTPQVFSAL